VSDYKDIIYILFLKAEIPGEAAIGREKRKVEGSHSERKSEMG